MGGVTVRAESRFYVTDEHGRLVQVEPGDWVTVNKMKARELLANGQATIPGTQAQRAALAADLAGAGLVVIGGTAQAIIQAYPVLQVQEAEYPTLPFDRTLVFWPEYVVMSPERANVGLALVDGTGWAGWEVAAVFTQGPKMAGAVGSKADQKGTLELYGDLRLPVYDPYAVWVRRTAQTTAFVEHWAGEIQSGTGPEHALLRALYACPVVLNSLVHGWMTGTVVL